MELIRAITGYENRPMIKIFEELANEYLERHRETLILIGIPGFTEECIQGLKEIKKGSGKDINDLED